MNVSLTTSNSIYTNTIDSQLLQKLSMSPDASPLLQFRDCNDGETIINSECFECEVNSYSLLYFFQLLELHLLLRYSQVASLLEFC